MLFFFSSSRIFRILDVACEDCVRAIPTHSILLLLSDAVNTCTKRFTFAPASDKNGMRVTEDGKNAFYENERKLSNEYEAKGEINCCYGKCIACSWISKSNSSTENEKRSK